MKKIYIMPATIVVKVATTKMIATSLGGLTNSGGTIILDEEEADYGSDGMGRGFGGLWDDEE
jgi:hypothetical protein